MIKTRLLSTAAILLLTSTAALAQDLKKNEPPAPAPAAQQNAPAEKVAPSMHAGDRRAPETTGQAPKAGELGTTPSLDKSGTSERGSMNDKGSMSKSESTDKGSAASSNAQIKSDTKANTAAEKSDSTTKSSQSSASSNATTGQGAASAAKLTTEQRTRITTIIKQQKVQPAHLNVSVSVGTRVPADVHLYPVPVEVVNIYPEWRGFDYIMVGDEIVVIDPHTHEIVAIIEA